MPLPTPESLVFGADDSSRTVDWSELSYESFRYWQSFEHQVDDQEFTLIAEGPTTIAVVIDGMAYALSDLDYSLDEDDEDYPPISSAVRDELEQAEPYMYGAEGPMMNYWYPFVDYNFDPVEGAAKIADLPLCVVEVDEHYGLALTGGGMDLSWQIAEAFILLGMYPPAFIESLPRFAGHTATPLRNLVIDAMLERNRHAVLRLEYSNEQLKRLREDMARGAL